MNSKIDEVEMPNIPNQVFTKFATQITNPQTFAAAVLGLVNKLSEKENASLLKNPKLKRAIDLLADLSGDEQEAPAEEPVNETLDPGCHDLADKICEYLGAKGCVDALVRAMSTDDCMFYLRAIARDYDIPDGSEGEEYYIPEQEKEPTNPSDNIGFNIGAPKNNRQVKALIQKLKDRKPGASGDELSKIDTAIEKLSSKIV
jgi:hypothetical protein